MGGNAAEIAAQLPPWLQTASAAALFVVAVMAGALGLLRGRAVGAGEGEAHEVEDLLASAPVRRLLECAEAVSDNARLQTEALKTISAAATAMAKTVEDDFDERRVQREVDRRLALQAGARAAQL